MEDFVGEGGRLFALHQGRDTVRYLAVRGLEFAAVAHFPGIPVHRTRLAFSVRVVAVPKDPPFVAAHQTAGLGLFRLPLENS
jgi:hypothetical protein